MVLAKKVKGGQKAAKKKAREPRRPGAKILKELDSKISLPEKPMIPPPNLVDYTTVLYGEKGIGKTSLVAQIPGIQVMMWEPRRRHLKIKQIPKQGEPRLDWPRFIQYVDLFISKGVQAVAIDTIDKAYEACLEHICADQGIAHPSQVNDYGGTWSRIKKEFEDTMNAMLHEDIHLIFTSHATTRTVKSRTGVEEFDQVQPTCAPAAFRYLKAATDIAIYFGYNGPRRSFTVRGNEFIWSSTGPEGVFMQPNGEPLTEFYAGTSPKEAYKQLNDAFKNKVTGYQDEE